MKLKRRSFLKLSIASIFAGTFGCKGDHKTPFALPGPVPTKEPKFGDAPVSTICPFCGVGCGQIVTTRTINGVKKVINLEGNPDHVINRGAVCSKGGALYQLAGTNNERRLRKVWYRAPNSIQWEEKDWTTAITRIAELIQTTRDAGYETTNTLTETVNRCNSIGALGGAALDNEECYALSKFLRALGVVYMEHQARI